MNRHILPDTTKVDGPLAEHIPVLAGVLAEQINLPPDGVMVDATIGHGGHSFLFGGMLGPEGLIIGLDVDENSIRTARSRLTELKCKVVLVNSNFALISEQIRKQGIDKVDLILADLGLCSAQLADTQTGLSFQANMPLDMRIDKRIKTTAADIVNETDEKSLADLIYKFGQDRASRRIARFIVRHRVNEPITTTGQLAAIVCKALARPGQKRKSRIHPATRTFQALRIAVNSELENLAQLLVSAPELLKRTGWIAIISYHSLEDRMVKLDFRNKAKDNIYRVITKKPIVPADAEIAENRRSRSAKLRIAQRQ
ncbi:MAG: 16S rRNA (cytosine(1402)-N(4))-methyltransferase RsmH [Sedimentisphaerales bacterium]|nr:16S rRNA (cytosine(1402)-N(4))-methyltransferase RsmH [Sedimentisphaerales bacterium]